MSSKKIILSAFILTVFVQLTVPVKMILDREDILNNGTEYKFRTAPIDPTDPFRGKYITLWYEEDLVEIQTHEKWIQGETVFVLLSTDDEGFAEIRSVAKKEPNSSNSEYVKARVNYFFQDNSNTIRIDYPFNRFYMEESKAYGAELAYRESQTDTTQTAYALVSIKEGDAVLKDVLINDIPIRELVKARQEENP